MSEGGGATATGCLGTPPKPSGAPGLSGGLTARGFPPERGGKLRGGGDEGDAGAFVATGAGRTAGVGMGAAGDGHSQVPSTAATSKTAPQIGKRM
jgi:hypothetical protein